MTTLDHASAWDAREMFCRWIVEHLIQILHDEERLKLPRSRFIVVPARLGPLGAAIVEPARYAYVPYTELEMAVSCYRP